ncbi:cytochrome b/b6 domain-containing protein [Glaciecola sp. MH2013]|uniref:cytochrome b/b6 domain-containing protein n=1 Tax=Glaciecola sp. MH2013 TaxID=2785524 RepID=UPI00189CCB80|nr:cytochrome b/b6 domain-containing protein [Glaciecola sp. MH2013]MBF7072536.1 cytochrome b/b6 domain-containing protein [Glaciecola sp. MH2013]
MKIYVWDFPTRIFHWLLVVTFAAQYLTGELLDDAMQWHFYGGYVMLGLIIFRLLWGIVGAYYARFSQFIHGPTTTIAYAKSLNKSSYTTYLGHNPLGAYSIIFVMSMLLTQTVSGLFITDDIFYSGPYHSVVSDAVEDIMNMLHSNAVNAVLFFLVLHITAMILYKRLKGQALLKAMVTGRKELSESQVSKLENIVASKNHWLRFVFVASLSAGAVYLIVVSFAPELADDFYY